MRSRPKMKTDVPSILVVDDNERFRTVLGLVLETNSFSVRTAATQTEALSYLKAEFFSLIIADYTLSVPGDSERIARSLLEAAHPIPVGCITGWSRIPTHIQSRYAFVLHKPVTAESILAAIGSLFSPHPDDRRRTSSVASYFRGLSEARWDLVASLCSESVTFNPPPDDPRGQPICGRRAFLQYAEETFRSFPNTTFAIQGMSFLPNGIVARYLGQWDSESGEKLQHRGEILFRFDGDLISEIGVRLDLAILKTLAGGRYG